MAEPSHGDIVRRVGAVEKQVAVLGEQVKSASNAVEQNRSLFSAQIAGITETQRDIRDAFVAHRGEFRGGMAVLAFLITAGTAVVAILI